MPSIKYNFDFLFYLTSFITSCSDLFWIGFIVFIYFFIFYLSYHNDPHLVIEKHNTKILKPSSNKKSIRSLFSLFIYYYFYLCKLHFLL